MANTQDPTNSLSTLEPPSAGCARIFRDIAGLNNSSKHFGWSDERLLEEPLKEFEVDSLTLLEFVMAVETAYGVELDEGDVNSCRSVGNLVQLVVIARNAS